jgi:hypothetical protein
MPALILPFFAFIRFSPDCARPSSMPACSTWPIFTMLSRKPEQTETIKLQTLLMRSGCTSSST